MPPLHLPLEVVEAGWKLPFFKCMSTIFFFCQSLNFWKILLTKHYTCWISLDFDLYLVYFVMQNYTITREWDGADWLDPLLCVDQGNHHICTIPPPPSPLATLAAPGGPYLGHNSAITLHKSSHNSFDRLTPHYRFLPNHILKYLPSLQPSLSPHLIFQFT